MNVNARRALLPIVGSLLTLVTIAPSAVAKHARVQTPCANADTPATGSDRVAVERAVVCLINFQRTSRGLPPLQVNARLNASAQGWSNSMVRSDRFSHGHALAARITAVGFNWSTVGENIATGFATPSAVVAAWMASTGHCQNILNPHFADVGTGISLHGIPAVASGIATWTQDFGLPEGMQPPSQSLAPGDGCPYRL